MAAFGPNVCVFTATMTQASIQKDLDRIASQQVVASQFDSQRYAVLFRPGTYGSAGNPLVFQVGYYTQVAGLGAMPEDTVNGAIDVSTTSDSGTQDCNRASTTSGVAIEPLIRTESPATWPTLAAGRAAPASVLSGLRWAAPNPGGYDSGFRPGHRQRFPAAGLRSNLGGWSNGVWNQVFSEITALGAELRQWGSARLATCPVTRRKRRSSTPAHGGYSVFVPAVQHNSVGPAQAAARTAPHPAVEVLRGQSGMSGRLSPRRWPGARTSSSPLASITCRPSWSRTPTVVLGLGMATLVPQRGNAAMIVVRNSGNSRLRSCTRPSPVLLSVGTPGPPTTPATLVTYPDAFVPRRRSGVPCGPLRYHEVLAATSRSSTA